MSDRQIIMPVPTVAPFGTEFTPEYAQDQVLGFLCGEGRCSDPWHTKEPS